MSIVIEVWMIVCFAVLLVVLVASVATVAVFEWRRAKARDHDPWMEWKR